MSQFHSTITTDGAWPLLRMRDDTILEELGTLHAFRADQFQFHPSRDRSNLMRTVDAVAGHFPGLPWFLDDLWPQGFLGRSLAHRCAHQLGVPTDLTHWQVRDALAAILRGGTGVGDLLLGEEAADRAITELKAPPDVVRTKQRPVNYPVLANRAVAGEEVGSSPGGEQPKFTATVETANGRYGAIVKFAMPSSGKAGERWAELLACEHLALTCLREAGFNASVSELVKTGGYTFLEVRRFDRVADTLGRRGFVSLLALDAAFIGEGPREWGLAGEQLLGSQWIDQSTADNMAKLHWFGRFIGNSDMHLGNIGFHLSDAGPLALCPAYDMLPMYLAPSRTGILRPAIPLRLVAPTCSRQITHIIWAAEAAMCFWRKVSARKIFASAELIQIATENHDVVASFASSIDSK
jgi:hypothetical protein